jgi:hypothetical protein
MEFTTNTSIDSKTALQKQAEVFQRQIDDMKKDHELLMLRQQLALLTNQKKPAFSIKTHLDKCKDAIGIMELRKAFIPEKADYESILNNGSVSGTLANIIRHFNKMSGNNKFNYPIQVSNKQTSRMKIYVMQDSKEWKEYNKIEATKYLEDFVELMSDKLLFKDEKFICNALGVSVGAFPSFYALKSALCKIEEHVHKIALQLVEYLIIDDLDEGDISH